MTNQTTKIIRPIGSDLEFSTPNNVIVFPTRITKAKIKASLEFAYDATKNIQYLNDIIRIEEEEQYQERIAA